MSVISGTLGAILGSAAQRAAAEANLEAARETNANNYRMFQESRGAGGSALLPLYFGGQEQKLANDATAFYNTTRNMLGTPDQQFQRYSQIIGQYQPMQDAARGSLADVFNGNMTTTRLRDFQPVAQARTDLARGQAQGVLQGLQERINALNADNARKGFTGSGSFAQNRLLGATIGARQQAAGTMAGANLANAQDVQNINDQGIMAKLQYMNMPTQLAQNALNLDMQPAYQVAQNFSREMAPFEFFRMSPQAFQEAPLPMQQPDMSWSNAMNNIGATNRTLGALALAGAFSGKPTGAGGGA